MLRQIPKEKDSTHSSHADSRSEFRSFGFSDEEATIYLKGSPEEVPPSTELLALRRYTSKLPSELVIFSPREMQSNDLHSYVRVVRFRRLGEASGFPPTFTKGFASSVSIFDLADLGGWQPVFSIESEKLKQMWLTLWKDCFLPWPASTFIWEYAGKTFRESEEIAISATSGEAGRLVISLFADYWRSNAEPLKNQYHNLREIMGDEDTTFNLGNFQKLVKSVRLKQLIQASFGLRFALFAKGYKHWITAS